MPTIRTPSACCACGPSVTASQQTSPTATPAQPLQDLAYEYDLAGNILAIRDRTPGSGIKDTPQGHDALDRNFTYDALYRLRSATGRECDRRRLIPPPWDDTPRCTDLTKTRELYRAVLVRSRWATSSN